MTVTLITGANKGIGFETAKQLVQLGHTVYVGARDVERGEKAAAELGARHVRLDVTDDASVAAALASIDADEGRLDVLVNNAGTVVEGKITDVSPEDWRKVMATDLDGVFYGCRAALPELIKTKGSIVNTSSVSGLGGDWGMSVYNAAKGAVTNFTRALAMDHGRDGVRVNAVCPSLTRSEMTDDMFENQELMNKFMERIPLGRAAEAEDIADVIAFLGSDDARFITGVNLPVDGGLSASNGQPPQT
jgi:meso-butanediol dehydrogenase/(S,S)-butanediol dehydrogenase/diacetyl reductase